MQDYIEEHLDQDISLNELADAACFSPWHSYRLFCQYTGTSIADYIRRLRLSRSALRLRDEKVKVADLAFDLGFGSVDGYQRAFLKEFGCNPSQYAKNPGPIGLFTPYGVKYKSRYEEKGMEKTKTVFITKIEKPQRKVIIKRGIKATDYWEYGEEVGCDIWGLLISMDKEPVSLWLPKAYVKPGTSVYVQGVEKDLDYNGPVPEGMDTIILPQAEYLMFQGESFEEADYADAIRQVWDAMDKYDPSILGYKWDEENPRIQLEPRGERGYIELKPIKRI